LDVFLQALVAFAVVIDPIGVAPMFVGLTRDLDGMARRRIALRSVSIAAVVLAAFGLFGGPLMEALGIGVAAFRVAGGILLLLAAIDMLFARPSGLRAITDPENREAAHRADVSVFPLAIPLIAGPGAITTVMLQTRAATGLAEAWVFAALAAVLALTLACLLAGEKVLRLLGVTGVNVIGRVLGIILAALACQLIIDGVKGSGLV